MSSNIGLVFYKTLFERHLGFKNLIPDFKPSSQNLKTELFDLPLPKVEITSDGCLSNKCQNFELTTVYPGLLLGSGYAHEIHGEKVNGKPTVENELKLGFFFDHTTGLPCIPGSSVKGALRSAFEKVHGQYVANILAELKAGKRYSEVQQLAAAFDVQPLLFQNSGKSDKFGNSIYYNSKFVQAVFEGDQLPIYKRDIFFDAFPVHSANQDNTFLSNDYLTPHEHPLKNPNPIQFLKVLPSVRFRFDFKLTDCIMPVNLKLELFRQILLDLGVGAKTNVGYGKFKNNTKIRASQVVQLITPSSKTDPLPYNGKINEGENLEAIVIDSAKKIVKAIINGKDTNLSMSAKNCPAVGSIVLVDIKTVNKKREILLVGFVKQLN